MKLLPKLLCSFLVFFTLFAHAQKENVVFPYSHDSLVELLKDTSWLKASAKKYMEYVKNGDIKRDFYDFLSAYVILNENEEGLKLLSKQLMHIEESKISDEPTKALISIC